MAALTCQQLLDEHTEAWQDATRHPFLNRCKDGSIEAAQFNTWLTQDYLFVTELVRFIGQLLAAAPVAHFDVLLGGLAALKDELNWFRGKAAERTLNLATPRQAICENYCNWLAQLPGESYAIQAVAFWAIEIVYNQAWQLPGPMPAPYDEFARRWGNADFTTYVGLLQNQADEALRTASPVEHAKAEAVFLRTMELEREFWRMAFAAA